MKSLVKGILFLSIFTFLFATSCKDDSDPGIETPEFDVLTQYMAQNNLDLSNVLSGWVSAGSGLNVDQSDYSLSDYYIMDFRNATDFAAGHIKDAVHVSLPNTLDEAVNAGGKKILCVCYTGQTAARAAGALRIMGYDAVSLKWGMSAWHENLAGKWNANAGEFTSSNWVTSGTPPANQTFDDPVFLTNNESGAAILEARVRTALQKSTWGVSKTAVLDNPGNYFIVNKWPLASWDEYGHISGAYRIDEELNLAGLSALNPTGKVVVYCYTGQTSAITSMWLDVLGYDSQSLLFGVNGIAHSKLLVGTAGSAPKKSWKGPGSGSEINYGFYDSDGNFYGPNE